MVTEFDLSRALFLTYVGVGAAFLVLGSLVVFTGLIGWWGSWRLRRAEARAMEAAVAEEAAAVEIVSATSEEAALDPQLAAAIGAAVALAVEAYGREQAAEEGSRPEVPQGNGGWREQGRLAAFDSRLIRERDRDR